MIYVPSAPPAAVERSEPLIVHCCAVFAASVVPVIWVEPAVVGICVPASCAELLAGTSLTFQALRAMLEVKLNVATFFPDCSEITLTSGPVIVIVGIAVDSVIVAELAELSLYTESLTLTYTVLEPSPLGSVTLLELENVSQDAFASSATPLMPQIFIEAASAHVIFRVTVADVVTLAPLLIVNADMVGANVSNVRLK